MKMLVWDCAVVTVVNGHCNHSLCHMWVYACLETGWQVICFALTPKCCYRAEEGGALTTTTTIATLAFLGHHATDSRSSSSVSWLHTSTG
jgi:hypothetical protein